MKIKFILLVIIFYAYSCTPDKFIIRHGDETPIDGFIIQNIDSVEVLNDQSLIINSGGIVSLRKVPLTEQHFDFVYELLEGEGADIFFKTAVDKFNLHPKIKLEVSSEYASIYEDNFMLSRVDSIKLKQNSKNKIHIRSTGNRYLVTINCDTLKYGITKIENSEFIIFKPKLGSKIKITNIYIDEEDSDYQYFPLN